MQVSINPFSIFREECKSLLLDAIAKSYPQIAAEKVILKEPPEPEFGELATPLCLEMAGKLGIDPLTMAKNIVDAINRSKFDLIESVEVARPGYINFRMNYAKIAELAIGSAMRDPSYGFVKTEKPLRIIVEHTSANPIHPIHVGAARNPVLGDALARMLKARGYEVTRHFYIDDVGRQVATIAYGYGKVRGMEMKMKPDHFIGQVYAITSCITSIIELNKRIKKLREEGEEEEVKELQRDLDDWVGAAAELESRNPELFEKLLDEIKKDEDPETVISKLIRDYEISESESKELVREVCELSLKGFKETLSRMGIEFDSWDWESDLVWSGRVSETLNRLRKTPYVFETEGVLELDADKVASDLRLREVLGLEEEMPIPSLTLTRRDGTTLYTTRDITYSLWKFERADRVVNVVGVEQKLAQLHVRIALALLGEIESAKNQIHFAYGLVELPGYRMSSRRGRYVTLDEIMDEAKRRAMEEVSKRSPQLSEEEKKRISEIIGIGAIKYALISLEPIKEMVFTWDRVLDFEKNSGPFIQYAHARACSILKKAEAIPEKVNYSLLNHPKEHELIIRIAKFPDLFVSATENLRPDMIAEFANELADRFNSFYDALPVLKAEPRELANARLALVSSVQRVLKNSLHLLGIEAPERM